MVKLFMVLLGAYPKGRYLEQHDIFFGIGISLKDLVPHILAFWPEANGKIHIDAWREVTFVDGYEINVVEKEITNNNQPIITTQLFFLNLGGYKAKEFEEFHYKMLVASDNKMTAIKQAKQTAFFIHTGFKGAAAHIDEKYGVDVDDIYLIDDILPAYFKEKYTIKLSATTHFCEDEMHLGYFKLKNLA